MRQPDIEIYLKDAERDAVAQWLGEALANAASGNRKARPSNARPAMYR